MWELAMVGSGHRKESVLINQDVTDKNRNSELWHSTCIL